MKTSPAAEARERAGLTLKQAAKRQSISVVYLRRLELHGGAPYNRARALSRLYKCPMMLFVLRSDRKRVVS